MIFSIGNNNGALLYLPVDLCHMHIGKEDEQQDQHKHQQQHNNEPAVFFYHKHLHSANVIPGQYGFQF